MTDESMALEEVRKECKETDDCSDSMNQSSREGDEPEASLEESTDQANVWAQQLFESQYLDLSGASPRGLMSPKFSEMGGFADLGTLCASPLFSDQLKFLQSWSPKVIPNTVSAWGSGGKTASTSEIVSTSEKSAESDPSSSDFMITSDSTGTGSGDEAKTTRKRKSVERDEGIDGSDGDDVVKEQETSNSSRSMEQGQKMKGPKRPREPRYEFKTRSEVDVIDDGYKWRKYGQKPVKSSPHPRNYYRCTTANCPVRKRVERSIEDPGLIVTSYEGTHTHPKINRPKNSSGVGWTSNESEGPQDLWSQVQNGIPATTSGLPDLGPHQDNLAHLPNLGNLFSAWPTLPFNLAQPPPRLQDNVSMIMAYQLVRLQFELQARIQQFMSYNAAQQGLAGGLSKNPFTNNPQGLPQFPLPDLSRLLQNYADLAAEPKQVPTPEPLNPSSLLSRRLNAARLRTSSLNPNTQKPNTLRNLATQQSMEGPQDAGPDLKRKLSGPGLPPRPSRSS